MNKIIIKYLPDIFPGVDFTLERHTYKQPYKVRIDADKVLTDEKWATYYDITKYERLIQTVFSQRMRLEMQLYEDVAIEMLSGSEMCTMETEHNGIIQMYDVAVTKEEQEYTGLWNVTIDYSEKVQDNVANPLSSDNVEKWYNRGGTVGILQAIVPKAPYVFTTTLEFYSGKYRFSVPLQKPYSYINKGDVFYFHILNAELNYLNITAVCVSVLNGYVNFETTYAENEDLGTISGQVILNSEPGGMGEIALNSKNDLIVNLFTFTKPKFLAEETKLGDAVKNGDDITIANAEIITAEIIRCKFWLKESDLWKIRYFAIADSISFTDGTNTYYASQTSEVLKQEPKDLCDLYEFTMNMRYNIMSTNQFR